MQQKPLNKYLPVISPIKKLDINTSNDYQNDFKPDFEVGPAVSYEPMQKEISMDNILRA